MYHSVFVCILVYCLTFLVSGEQLMAKGLTYKEATGSNIVQTSRFLFPRYRDEPLCKTDLGQLGMCVDVRVCNAARRAVSAGNHPVRCGWIDNFIPMVCCHPDQVQQPKLRLLLPYFTQNR